MENNPEPKKTKWRLNLFDIIFIACALLAAGLVLIFSSRSDNTVNIISSG